MLIQGIKKMENEEKNMIKILSYISKINKTQKKKMQKKMIIIIKMKIIKKKIIKEKMKI